MRARRRRRGRRSEAIRLWAQERGFELPAQPEDEGCHACGGCALRCVAVRVQPAGEGGVRRMAQPLHRRRGAALVVRLGGVRCRRPDRRAGRHGTTERAIAPETARPGPADLPRELGEAVQNAESILGRGCRRAKSHAGSSRAASSKTRSELRRAWRARPHARGRRHGQALRGLENTTPPPFPPSKLKVRTLREREIKVRTYTENLVPGYQGFRGEPRRILFIKVSASAHRSRSPCCAREFGKILLRVNR